MYTSEFDAAVQVLGVKFRKKAQIHHLDIKMSVQTFDLQVVLNMMQWCISKASWISVPWQPLSFSLRCFSKISISWKPYRKSQRSPNSLVAPPLETMNAISTKSSEMLCSATSVWTKMVMKQSDSNNSLKVTQTQTQLQIEKNKMAETQLQFCCTTNFLTPLSVKFSCCRETMTTAESCLDVKLIQRLPTNLSPAFNWSL